MTPLAHLVHYALLGAGAAVVGWLLLAPALVGPQERDRVRRVAALRSAAESNRLTELASEPRQVGSDLLTVAALASLGAAATHALATPSHSRESALLGLFFVTAALGQALWCGLVLSRPGPGLLIAGIGSNAAVLLLWVWTRTVGVPFGLGAREPIGSWDTTACVLEIVLVVTATAAVGRGLPTPTCGRPAITFALLTAATLFVLAATGLPA